MIASEPGSPDCGGSLAMFAAIPDDHKEKCGACRTFGVFQPNWSCWLTRQLRHVGRNPPRLSILVPSTVVIPAMPIEGIIDPACARTIRRSPKRSSPDCAHNATNHSANRPSDHKPGPNTECCANSIGFRTCRSSDHQENWCGGQQSLAHRLLPLII